MSSGFPFELMAPGEKRISKSYQEKQAEREVLM